MCPLSISSTKSSTAKTENVLPTGDPKMPEKMTRTVQESSNLPDSTVLANPSVENTTVNAGGELPNDDDDDDDYEDGEEIIARHGIRDEAGLIKNGLSPVWTSWGGYPGVVPEEISEYLNDDGKCRKYRNYHPACNSRSETFH